MTSKHDHPSHYGGKDNPYEAIKVIEAWGLGFHLGNTVKYIARAGKKVGERLVEDLQKAEWYLKRMIDRPSILKDEPGDAGWLTSTHYDRVAEFMRLACQEVKEQPAIPDLETRMLRAKLVLEEALELIDGLGIHLTASGFPVDIDVLEFHEIKGHPPCLERIADGCADLSVVNIGTMIACGIKDVALLEEVDSNNLAKFGPGGHRREDGKWVKPPGHKPPNIERVLEDQGWRDPNQHGQPGYETE